MIPEPEVKVFDLQESDQFMIMASDGVWEFISSQVNTCRPVVCIYVVGCRVCWIDAEHCSLLKCYAIVVLNT